MTREDYNAMWEWMKRPNFLLRPPQSFDDYVAAEGVDASEVFLGIAARLSALSRSYREAYERRRKENTRMETNV